jgi:hypothetical protein
MQFHFRKYSKRIQSAFWRHKLDSQRQNHFGLHGNV